MKKYNFKNMKTRKVITNTRIRLPFQSTILYSFLLYYFNVSEVYLGIFGAVYVIYWSLAISIRWNEEAIDIFDEEEMENTRPTFKERLKEKVNEQVKNNG